MSRCSPALVVTKPASALALLGVLTALPFGCLAGCRKSDARDELARRRVVVGITQEPDTLFMPLRAMRISEMVVRSGAYTLTVYDEQWRLVPWAAQEIPTLENGGVTLTAEGEGRRMVVTWRLRPDFAWPDGTPLTADDFVFGHEVQAHPELEVLERAMVENVLRMEAAGDDRRTLVVTFKQPYAYYDVFDQHLALPAHLLAEAFREDPKSAERSGFAQRPALAGAFTIAEWAPGSHVVARRNPAVKPPFAAALDEIVWRIIPKANALEANLLSGTLDATAPTAFTFDAAASFAEKHGDRFDVHLTESPTWEQVTFNLDHPALRERDVRRALAYAADREGIATALFAGKQPVAHGTVPERSPYYADVVRYPHDPKKARALLDAAGWSLDKDGVRRKDGVPLAFTLYTTNDDRSREQVGLLLKSQWEAAGAKVELKTELPRILLPQTVRRRAFDGAVMFAWSMLPDEPRANTWRCDRIPSEVNAWSGQNFAGWCHEEVTRIFEEASEIVDDEERAARIHRFQHIFAEELPALPLWFRVEVTVTRKGLRGWRPTGTFQGIGWNAHEWHWATEP